jgi:hypothetical protein
MDTINSMSPMPCLRPTRFWQRSANCSSATGFRRQASVVDNHAQRHRGADAAISAKEVYPSYRHKRHEEPASATATASLTPEGRAVDSAVNAVCILSLGSTVLFPAPLIPDREIVVSVRQHVRLSLLPQFEGNAQKFEVIAGY